MPANQGPREATDTSLTTSRVCAEGAEGKEKKGTLREADEGIAKSLPSSSHPTNGLGKPGPEILILCLRRMKGREKN